MTEKNIAPIKNFTKEQLAELVTDIYRSGMVIGTPEFKARCNGKQAITSIHSSVTGESVHLPQASEPTEKPFGQADLQEAAPC